MFLERLLNTNEPLVSAAFDMQQHGVILPDTYILDLDMITCNAEAMKKEADSYGIKLYFMLKQLGRNPLVAKRIQEIGFEGVVCVDFREALTMKENGIRLGNVGHLVQTPWAAMEEIVAAHPDIMTVYSVEKAKEIGKAAVRHGFVQPIMLRVLGKDDDLYPGQCGGFPLENLDAVVKEIERIDGVHIAGVCSFPCLLPNDRRKPCRADKPSQNHSPPYSLCFVAHRYIPPRDLQRLPLKAEGISDLFSCVLCLFVNTDLQIY